MKKTNIIFAIFIALLTLISCTSLPSKSSYISLPELNTKYSVSIDVVTIRKDQIEEKEISNQFANILPSMISSFTDSDAQELKLSVEINQRSFIKDIKQLNSIYVFYNLTTSDGVNVLSNGYYVETISSIVSAQEQYEISKEISSKINAYLKQSTKVVKEK